jgi:hypothetical protein
MRYSMLKLPTQTMKIIDFPPFPASDRFSKMSHKETQYNLLITEKTSPQGLAIFDVLERSLIVLRWIE